MAVLFGMDDEERRQKLRPLLYRRWVMYPVLAYGLLGGDPNGMTQDEHLALGEDLRSFGYVSAGRPRCASGWTMFVNRREEVWPEEMRPERYRGLPLDPDPDLLDWDADD